MNEQNRKNLLKPAAAAGEENTFLADFRHTLGCRTPAWVNPLAEQRAIEREADLIRRASSPKSVQPVSAIIFGLAVEFGPEEEIWFYDANSNLSSTKYAGPAKGRIPVPGKMDNQTVWYDPSRTAKASFYTNLIVGYTGVGRIRMDLTDPRDDLPGINLAGFTAQDYFDQMAGSNNVRLDAAIEGWIELPHCEAMYGAPNYPAGTPDGGAIINGANVPVSRLVTDALAAFIALHPEQYTNTCPDAFWPRFDANSDGVLDACWIFHAGKGEETGGGCQGEFAIWSHSGDLRNEAEWSAGFKIYEGDPTTTNDDIVVGPYAVFPEHVDLGALTAALCRNLFGLPTLDTEDLENSIGFWASPAAGSWTGPLGGAAPAPLPLWLLCLAQTADSVFLNWQEPILMLDHHQPAGNVTLGRLENTPPGLPRGAIINLPPIINEPITNRLGVGHCAFSGRGRDLTDVLLERKLAVPVDATNLTFRFACKIETDWDYGYFMANGVSLPDLDDILTTNNPYGNNLGHGLTGETEGALRFNVAAWRGQTVNFAWRYKTDEFVTDDGWWVDDICFDQTLVEDFETADAPDSFPEGWSNSSPGWFITPITYAPTNFYLLEWRSNGKYDSMARTAFTTVYADEHDWRVARAPYHLPGALLYHRDARYRESRWLSAGYMDIPSFGPKYQLLLVDMNSRAVHLAQTGAYHALTFDARVGSFDAALSLKNNPGFTLEEVWAAPSTETGRWTILPRPAISSFRDTKSYVAGFEANDPFDRSIYYANLGGSATIPAAGNYSIRITDRSGNPYWMLYGLSIYGYSLGSGCPGADNKALGLGIRLIEQSENTDRACFTIGLADPDEKLAFRVQKIGAANGSVRSIDGKIFCDNTATSAIAFYAPGSVVTLQAQPEEGSFFAGWSSADVEGTRTQAIFQIYDDTSVFALFPTPPIAQPDSFRVPAIGARTIIAPGVLENDINLEHGRLWAELVSGCSTGSLDLRPDGSFTYTPPRGFIGVDSFAYRAVGEYDIASSNTANVTLLVQSSYNDFNGNGCSDTAVYCPSIGAWYIQTLAKEEILWNIAWGGPGLMPVCGDFNGDGIAELAVYNNSSGLWYITQTNTETLLWAMPWGGPGYEPMPGDFDGDSVSDLAVYHRPSGAWFIKSLASSNVIAWNLPWGGPGLVPVAGDFDGNGVSDLAVYDCATGNWYIQTINGSVLAWALAWGGAGFTPVGGIR